MISTRKRKDLEFAIDDAGGNQRIFDSFPEAAAFAISLATSGRPHVDINVLIYTAAAARAWGGEDAEASYREDSDASISERIRVTAESLGRVA